MPLLEFLHEERVLFVFPLRAGRTRIGRSDHADVSLPSDSVSRLHCVIDRRTEGWVVADRSKHGTLVHGRPLAEPHLLADGDEIRIGSYVARFVMRGDEQLHDVTATGPGPAAVHEEVVEATPDVVATSSAVVRFVRGPREGDVVVLNRARTSLGGDTAVIRLAPDFPSNAGYIRLVRGRPMVEPGACALFLAGSRVRELTPIWKGEEVRIGDHGLVVEVDTAEAAPREESRFGDMIGESVVMRRLFGVLTRLAVHDHPVLLTGESGTGKELAARGMHEAGPRYLGPFVAINCAAIADTLVESELFGHEKGAFTGADRRTEGAFQQADGGTLFLDEVGELRLESQAKLLRTLESGEVRRVGGGEVSYPDVRLIAATNQPLSKMVDEGTFRADLFFRLNVLTVNLPPLRQRREDLGAVANALLRRHHPGAELTAPAMFALGHHSWPGNIRELKNVLTRAVVLGGPMITPESLSFQPWEGAADGATGDGDSERARLMDALRTANGNRTEVARTLGMPRSSLLYRMRKLGIS